MQYAAEAEALLIKEAVAAAEQQYLLEMQRQGEMQLAKEVRFVTQRKCRICRSRLLRELLLLPPDSTAPCETNTRHPQSHFWTRLSTIDELRAQQHAIAKGVVYAF